MSNWAKTIGGILRQNGYTDFLGNCGVRKTAEDPVREALALLGTRRPGKPLRPAEWAKLAVEEGLAKTLFSPNERENENARERAIGVLMKRHLQVTFVAETDQRTYRLRLDGGAHRWVAGRNPHTRYLFEVLNEHVKPIQDHERDGPR